MFKLLITALLLSIAPLAHALDIPKDAMVANEYPGYCTWACIETLGKTQGMTVFEGLVAERKKTPPTIRWNRTYPANYGYHWSVVAKLKKAKVSFLDQEHKDKAILLKYAHKYGAIVGVDLATDTKLSPGILHSLIILDYKDNTNSVPYFDPNGPEVRAMDKKWFDKAWTGDTYVLFPNR